MPKIALTPFERLLQDIDNLGEDDFQNIRVKNTAGKAIPFVSARRKALMLREIRKSLLGVSPEVTVFPPDAPGELAHAIHPYLGVPPKGTEGPLPDTNPQVTWEGVSAQTRRRLLSEQLRKERNLSKEIDKIDKLDAGTRRAELPRDPSKISPSFEDPPPIEELSWDRGPGGLTSAEGASLGLSNPRTEQLRLKAAAVIAKQPFSDQGDRLRGALKELDGHMAYREGGGGLSFGDKNTVLREILSDPSAHNINAAELKVLAPNSYGVLRASVNMNLKEVGLPGWESSRGWDLAVGASRKMKPPALMRSYAKNAKLAFDKGNVAAAMAYGKAFYAAKTGRIDYAKQEALNAREYVNPRTALVLKGHMGGAVPLPPKGVAVARIRLPIERAGFPTDELADGPNLTPQDNTEYDMPWRTPGSRKGPSRSVRGDMKRIGEEIRSIRGLGGQPAVLPGGRVSLSQHRDGPAVAARLRKEGYLQKHKGFVLEEPVRTTPFWEHIKDPEARKVAKRLQKASAKNPLPGKWMQAFETASRKGDTQASLYLKALRNFKAGEKAAILEEVGPQGLKYLTKLIKLLK